MRKVVLGAVMLLGCHDDPGPPPSAPVAIEVPPMASSSSNPQLQSPPPNPDPFVQREPPKPADSAEEGQSAPVTPSPFPPRPSGTKGFDHGAAAHALITAPIQSCAIPGGPTGPGRVTMTWDPSGRVQSVTVNQGVFAGTAVGGCLARVYSTLTIPPFAGAPVRVGKSFVLQ